MFSRLSQIPTFISNPHSEALRFLRKESDDIHNRIHSIAEDSEFVRRVHQAYPTLPLLPNLRCGAWYTDPEIIAHDAPAYFKSTDGHFGVWSFNLRRANLHLLPLVIDAGGIILTDSTRSGKRLPDALSKTIPIWCAVINRAVARVHNIVSLTGSLDTWDVALYTPPSAVSLQEHAQIEGKIDAWVDALCSSSYILPRLPHPLRPLWITPSTSTFPSIPTRDSNPAPTFLPVICVSASKFERDRREQSLFTYVQGSGDDHELWAQGLTPPIFWKNRQSILSAARTELPHLVESLVAHSRSGPDLAEAELFNYESKSRPIAKVKGKLMLCCVPKPIVYTTFTQSLTRGDTSGVAFLLLFPLSASPAIDDAGTEVQDNLHEHAQLKSDDVQAISTSCGKRGALHLLSSVLPQSIAFISAQLCLGRNVCVVHSEESKEEAVGVILTALASYFDADGEIQLHDRMTVTKQSIRMRLEWIVTSLPGTNPARATLKRVNEYLMSDARFRAGLTRSGNKI